MSDITAPTFAQLAQEFAFIQDSEFEGIKGVWQIESGNPGPVLGITVSTHGNEPSGLAALWYLRNVFKLADNLLRGSVFLVINNIRATEHYFAAVAKQDDVAKKAARLCDHNMNRLPENSLILKGDTRYEVLRAQELQPVWEKFEVAFDIHSTSMRIDPMIIACGGLQENLIKGFPMDILITNIEKVQVEKPAVSFYGIGGKIKTLAIEAGSHDDPAAFKCSIACTLALLKNLNMVAGENEATPKEYQLYEVAGSVMFPDLSFELEKIFDKFEVIKEGQILARGKGTRIVADFDGHAVMGPEEKKTTLLKEEVMFLSRPVRKLTI